MLTKAILTGGVLSVLAGAIVYFATEGADALERDTREAVRIEETELAGAAVPEVAEVEVDEAKVKAPKKKKKKRKAAKTQAQSEASAVSESDTLSEAEIEAERLRAFETVTETVVVQAAPLEWPAENLPEEVLEDTETPFVQNPQAETPPSEKAEKKPKTRWLDQYLKSDKSKEELPEPKSEVIDVVIEKSDEMEMKAEEKAEVEAEVEVEVEGESGKKMMATIEEGADPLAAKQIQKKIIIKMEGENEFVWSSDDDGQMDGTVDMEMIEKLLSEHSDLDLETMTDAKKKIRVVTLGGKKGKAKGHHGTALKAIDYNAVLLEAKKLQVVDMRNEAFLEIVDYAIDRGDIGEAADIVDELSSPELRDTARARIGVGLATSGDMEAAFAVLEEIEIDELSAPIRLEIISALMATRAERAARHQLR